jgi:hypothetical protein
MKTNSNSISEHQHDGKSFEQIWQELGNIPEDEDGNIDEEFYDFPAGTEKYEVWQWIEELFPDVVLGDVITFKIK